MLRPAVLLACLLIGGVGIAADPPPQSLDWSRWKLTLPIDSDLPGRPDEIEKPQLTTFHDPKHFIRSADGASVIFRAYCDGMPTKGSTYPRCELREVQPDSRKDAAWSTSDDQVHELAMRVAITRLPAKKPHAVCAQIHDAKSDVVMVRLEGTKLFVERKPEADVMLDRSYALGTPLDLKIEAGQGRIRLWHDGVAKMDWEVAKEKCYFKAGCYVQSNLTKGDSAEEYGEVVIHRLTLRDQ